MLRCHGVSAGPLEDVALDLAPGLTVVTGEPGCGTSTLLRVLAGQERPISGTVEGGPVTFLEAPPGSEWEAADVVQHALGAPHLIGRPTGAMSAGERQRVRLANLLASDAPVLLLDEPLGLLDAGGRRLVIEVLKDDGRPMLIACKTYLELLAAADQVLTLVAGRLE